MDEKLLRIYLQDHLALATGGGELSRRARASNKGTPYGTPLSKLADEIEEDRRALQTVMKELGFGADRAKVAAAWTAEKMGRLKPNGRLTGYSPLSRMIELEGLIAGVNGKLSLWRTLRELAESDSRLNRERLGRLVERAEAQRALLDDLRSRAASEAFAG